MDTVLLALVEKVPEIASLVIVCGGFIYFLARLEERHSIDRLAAEQRAADRFKTMGDSCHDSQEHTANAIDRLATSVSESATATATHSSQLTTLISEIRR